ncbi:PREDICTED: protein ACCUMULATION AND REPLICATION OF CHLOROPLASTS 3 [Brassica oleracea var. oleracea]|uniref:Protein ACCUMULATION AND REPLICATION OF CHLOROPLASTS 3 n=1 Tax=Brassica oleracea var. oleracea TaxID=109376 RepID=A0A0D3D0S4_BRAOL|nr:PREDICTED: protein ACCUMULATION AND REPLICATION OF CHLOROPLASTS 3 [Brassica oleracea var. oleracea]
MLLSPIFSFVRVSSSINQPKFVYIPSDSIGAMTISVKLLPVFSTLLRAPLFSPPLPLLPSLGIQFPSAAATSRLNCTARKARRRICVMCLARDSASAEHGAEFIEVLVIGSRKESIMDSCLDSPFPSLPLRFWSISRDSSGDSVLQQRLHHQDNVSKTMNPIELIQSPPKAFILVASAGYGSDQVEAINILSAVRSGGSLAVAVLLRPFSFEGRRRLEEVNELAKKLQQHTSFCIDIDIEILLQKDLVTLDEALRNANNAVSKAINAASSLISGMHGNFIDVVHKDLRELEDSEVTTILESYKEAKVGFGVGHNLKTSILQAIYDCPFFRPGVKDLKAIICIVATSVALQKKDVKTILRTFRQTMEYTGDIIVSTVHEPDLEPKVLVTAFFILSSEEETSSKGNIFSGVLPFVVNIFKKYRSQLQKETSSGLGEAPVAVENSAASSGVQVSNQSVEGFEIDSEELLEVSESGGDSEYLVREEEPSRNSRLGLGDDNIEDYGAIQREPIANWSVDPGYQTEQNRAADSGDTAVLSLGVVNLPVGVRPSKNPNSGLSVASQPSKKAGSRDESFFNSNSSRKGSSDDTASTLLSEKYADFTKQRNLSARAASMLEAERDSSKRWSPIQEMQYRGGLFKGRCQGGLPEGKGRLVLGDGSIYDGMWHNGKRSGLGTFYFKNGDVFQGTWREDLIQGKGWFYFHRGDRWFANFWKGKASGEGRFYSKSGEIFFGQFKDGWRDGQFLCIDVDGTRYSETWDDGVLISRKQMDAGD